MEIQKVNLLYYLRKGKIKRNGEAPIYLRITINGNRSELPTGKFINPENWDSRLQVQKGRNEEARTLNHYLEKLKVKVYQDCNLMTDAELAVTADALKMRLKGIKETQITLIDVFEKNNELIKREENKNYSKSTIRQYGTTLQRLREFLEKEYGRNDIPLTDLEPTFIRRFEIFLRTEYNNDHNTVMKYLKQLKKVVHFAMQLGYIDRDPFMSHKTAFKETNRGYLTKEELDRIETKQFRIPRLERVKDIFLFVCYTGISYTDLKKLSPKDVVQQYNASWIILNREKTGVRSPIPLIPQALDIISKYVDDPECNANNQLLPVKSNQKLNTYLSEIAELCEIDKHITMHCARHSNYSFRLKKSELQE